MNLKYYIDKSMNEKPQNISFSIIDILAEI
jgi:hypothetical protein